MSAIINHLKGIFTTGKGTYINEYGEEVHGRLPRQRPENPFKVLMRPTFINYVYFFVGWMAWTMDGYDFHSISLSVSRLAIYYNKHRDDISTSITLTLLFRPIGAIVFGLAGDLYGRKWPMIINLIMIAMMQLATAYCYTFKDFLIVRSFFGVGMGGIWGNSVSMALENLPTECRGLFSGVLQQGYALGYLIAAVFNLGVVPKSHFSFKALFYIGAGLTAAIGIMRLFFPESKQFVEQRQRAKENPELAVTGRKKVAAFIKDAKMILKQSWRRCIYAVILMALFNCMSHVSQDMYPTYMQQSKGFSSQMSSKATIVQTTGAVVGGTLIGYYSQFFGRRAAIMTATIVGACLIPLWIIPTAWGPLAAGAFFIQFCVQGAWGVVPVHLNELSPPQFRSSFPGISYQLGNMISAPMAQILSKISEHLRLYVTNPKTGKVEERPDYGKTQAIMMSIIFILLCIWTACGNEARGTHFELAGVAGDTSNAEKARALEEVEHKVEVTRSEDQAEIQKS